MARVTEEDKIKFNELYAKLGTYAAVARETGFSASTVRRYIVKDSTPVATPTEVVHFSEKEMKDLNDIEEMFKSIDDWSTMCELDDEEKEEIKVLWKELVM